MSDEDYKTRGKQAAPNGAGVLGHNTATSGTPVGVEGRVAGDAGYGLYTDDDATVGGRLDADELRAAQGAVENLTAGTINGVHFAVPEGDQSGLESIVSTASSGDRVVLTGGTYVVDDPPLVIDKRLDVRGWGSPVVKLGDGVLDESDVGAGNRHVVEIRRNGDGGRLADVEIDGNAGNQSGDFSNKGPYSHGLRIGGNNNNAVANYSVERCYIHDTIRSCLSGKMVDSTVVNCRFADSFNDHHLYLAGSRDCTVRDVTAEGFARKASLVFGTEGKATVDPVVDGYTYTNVSANPHNSDPDPQVTIRNQGATAGGTIANLKIDTSATTAFGTRVAIQAPDFTGENWVLKGHLSKPGLDIKQSADRTTVDGLRVTISSADTDNWDNGPPAIVNRGADDVRLSDVRLIESTGSGIVPGLQFQDPARQFLVQGLYVDLGKQWIKTNSAVDVLAVQQFTDERSEDAALADGTGLSVDGYATESGAAQRPQATYQTGTVVEYTDTDDGSGNGTYLITPTGPVTL